MGVVEPRRDDRSESYMAVQDREPSLEPGQGQDYKDAKAAAKAAKAYAKAQRPWYKKKRYILSLAGILLVVVAAASSGGTTEKSGTTTPSQSGAAAEKPATDNASESTSKAAPAATGPTAKLPIQNGDWRLDSVTLKDDGLGDFAARARITYTGQNPDGGDNIFTLTVFKGGKDVAALTGSANSVKPGTAATVEFISQDHFVGGPYKFDFQNDI
jgi:hypothetical protein